MHIEALAAHGDIESIHRLENGPKLSPLTAHIWGWFIDLARCRQYGGMGSPLPINYRDIAAWQDVTGNRPDPWEMRALIRLDAAWFEAQPKPEKKAR